VLRPHIRARFPPHVCCCVPDTTAVSPAQRDTSSRGAYHKNRQASEPTCGPLPVAFHRPPGARDCGMSILHPSTADGTIAFSPCHHLLSAQDPDGGRGTGTASAVRCAGQPWLRGRPIVYRMSAGSVGEEREHRRNDAGPLQALPGMTHSPPQRAQESANTAKPIHLIVESRRSRSKQNIGKGDRRIGLRTWGKAERCLG